MGQQPSLESSHKRRSFKSVRTTHNTAQFLERKRSVALSQLASSLFSWILAYIVPFRSSRHIRRFLEMLSTVIVRLFMEDVPHQGS